MKKNRLMAFVGLLALPTLIWFVYNSSANENPPATRRSVPVRVAKVVKKELAFPIHASGKVASKAELNLAFKVGGILQRVAVDEGDFVRKGQVLASLNLAEISAQVTQARAGYEKAERDYQRVQNLFADSVATLAQMQDARSALDVAQANLRIAEFNAEYAKIIAPTDGYILKRYVEANELVSPGSNVFRFGSTAKDWVVRVSVIDRDVVRLNLGDSVSVEFDVYENEPFVGTVAEIAESADPMTGTFEVEVRLKPDARRVVSGFFAQVDIFPSEKKMYSFIPIEALYEGDGMAGTVFTIDLQTNTANKQRIVIGRVLNRELAVIRGLENVSEVVTEGAAYLGEGKLVNIVP